MAPFFKEVERYIAIVHTIGKHGSLGASGTWGCGVCRWTPSWADINIAAKEFVPILLDTNGLSHIIIRCDKCDNMAVVSIINSKKCADKLVAHLLRCCHYLGAQFDVTVTAEHIQGK